MKLLSVPEAGVRFVIEDSSDAEDGGRKKTVQEDWDSKKSGKSTVANCDLCADTSEDDVFPAKAFAERVVGKWAVSVSAEDNAEDKPTRGIRTALEWEKQGLLIRGLEVRSTNLVASRHTAVLGRSEDLPIVKRGALFYYDARGKVYADGDTVELREVCKKLKKSTKPAVVTGVLYSHRKSIKLCVLGSDSLCPFWHKQKVNLYFREESSLDWQFETIGCVRRLLHQKTPPDGRCPVISLVQSKMHSLPDTSPPTELASDFFASLDADQKRAAIHAITAPLTILHGPPGTGKTTTLVALIQYLCAKGASVIVTAPSHAAVDNILSRVKVAPATCVRLGELCRVAPGSQEFMDGHTRKANDLMGRAKDAKENIQKLLPCLKSPSDRVVQITKRLLLDEQRSLGVVVFATCATSGGWFDPYTFDYVIVDEAAQANAVDTMRAAVCGKQVVLAGDHRQLGPVVKSKKAVELGFAKSLFEELWENHRNCVVMLRIQRRMHSAIMNWSSATFYNSKLIAHDSVSARVLAPGLRPVVWMDTCGENMPETRSQESSIYNVKEANMAFDYFKDVLLPLGTKNLRTVGVISPYRAQVKLLERLFLEAGPSIGFNVSTSNEAVCVEGSLVLVKIGTVDSFQGGEADAIVVSLVRSNSIRASGFLSERRRINVIATRAKMHLAIIGDSDTTSSSAILKGLREYINSLAATRDKRCDPHRTAEAASPDPPASPPPPSEPAPLEKVYQPRPVMPISRTNGPPLAVAAPPDGTAGVQKVDRPCSDKPMAMCPARLANAALVASNALAEVCIHMYTAMVLLELLVKLL